MIADRDHHQLRTSGKDAKFKSSLKDADKTNVTNDTVADSDRRPLKTKERDDIMVNTDMDIDATVDHIRRQVMRTKQILMTGPSVADLSTSDGDDAKTDPPRLSLRMLHTAIHNDTTTSVTGAARVGRTHDVVTAAAATDATKTYHTTAIAEKEIAEDNHAHDAEIAVEVKGTMLEDHAHDHTTAVAVAKTDRMNNGTTATRMANEAAAVSRATDGDKTQDVRATTDGTLQPN